MSSTYGRAVIAQPLSEEDRHHGLLALNLIGAWDDWVKRRVEAITFHSDTTVVRRVSVDFRLRPWLPEPLLKWGNDRMHYFPLALLQKEPLLTFDIRDENDHAVPLLTRRKNAALAAAALSSLAQLTVWTALGEKIGFPRLEEAGLPPDPRLIRVPRPVEDDFLQLTYRPYCGTKDHPGADDVLTALTAVRPTLRRPLTEWKWTETSSGGFESDAEDAEWRWQLLRDRRMRQLLSDFARLWMVSVPIVHEGETRRIVKFSYREHRLEPLLRFWRRRKAVLEKLRLARVQARLEDWLEGLPSDKEDPSEWTPQHSLQREPSEVGLPTKLSQALGWGSHVVEFEAPAVGLGGSYHLELHAPEGTQIRRATLTATANDEILQESRLRGARSLERAHLYVGDVEAGAQGKATVSLKPRTSTMVRALCMLAGLSFAMLLLARLKLPVLVDQPYGGSGGVVPFFFVFPGLVAAMIARSSEHAMTTRMVFGLRVLAGAVAAWPVLAGTLLATARTWTGLPDVWTGLVVGSGITFGLLVVSWRLAGRRRPDGSVP